MGRKQDRKQDPEENENRSGRSEATEVAPETSREKADKAHPAGKNQAEDIHEASPCSEEDEESAEQQTKAETERLEDQLLRLRADFDNYRKRTLRDRASVCDSANRELMTELLPVLDHFQLAVKAADEHDDADAAFREGLQMVFDQLMGVLTKFGLEPIKAEGRPFDPNLDEAINYLPSDTQPEGIVLSQTRCGYLLKNVLIRPAQVIVSSGIGVDADIGNESDATRNS